MSQDFHLEDNFWYDVPDEILMELCDSLEPFFF